MSSAQPPSSSQPTHSAHAAEDEHEDPRPGGSPPVGGDPDDEAPFEPDDDSDLGLMSDDEGPLSDQDLADSGDDLAGGDALVDSDEECLAQSDTEPVGELFGMEPELLGGDEDGWTEASEEDGTDQDGFDHDLLEEGGGETYTGDAGEEGFAGEDDSLADLTSGLPPLDRSFADDDDDDEGVELDDRHGGDLIVSDDDDEDLDGGVLTTAAATARRRDPRADSPRWLEVWPGVRWSMLPETAWRLLDITTGEAGAGSRLAADEHGLYVLHRGCLTRHSLRASEVRPARGLPTATASLCAGAGVLWAATVESVYRSRDAGASFTPVCASPGTGVPRLGMVKPGLPFISQGERLFRFLAKGERFVSASPIEPVTMWSSDGAGSVVVGQRGGPLLRSIDGGVRWTELPLAVDGVSDLWSCRDVVVVATAQGVLASRQGEWLQLLPPSATVCAVVGEPRVPRLYACLAYPDGWVLVRRPCDDASWRPRIVTKIEPALGAPVFLSARHDQGETRLYLVGETGIAKLLVRDA